MKIHFSKSKNDKGHRVTVDKKEWSITSFALKELDENSLKSLTIGLNTIARRFRSMGLLSCTFTEHIRKVS